MHNICTLSNKEHTYIIKYVLYVNYLSCLARLPIDCTEENINRYIRTRDFYRSLYLVVNVLPTPFVELSRTFVQKG